LSLAILDVNDAQLHVLSEDSTALFSSGYVSFGADTMFGDEAKQSYWLHPGKSDSKFWSLLSTAPWAPGHQLPVRHRADVAYAQLKKLCEQANARQLILLVPASFSGSQLGLLVGMCEALPDCKVVAVASNALLSAISIGPDACPSKFVFADTGLHKVECYVFESENGTLTEQEHRIFSDLGEFELEVAVARHIANRFIQLHRYDPQHTAQGDQTLHNEIPNWLEQLSSQSSITVSLSTNHGDAQVGVQASEISELLAAKLQPFVEYIQSTGIATWVTPRFAKWLKLAKVECGYSIVHEGTSAGNALAVKAELIEKSQPLHRISSLMLSKSSAAPDSNVPMKSAEKNAKSAEFASHILIDNKVLAIDGLALIAAPEGGAHVAKENQSAQLKLELNKNNVRLIHLDSEGKPSDKTSAKERGAIAGESIELFNQTYLLVNLSGNEK